MHNLIARLLFISILLQLLAQPQAAHAQESYLPAPAAYDWKEIRTESFAILYTAAYEDLGQVLFALYGQTLEQEYDRFQLLFDASLLHPISIRVYPTEDDYYRLNALAPKAAEGGTHSHIGLREIALIGENIATNLALWQNKALNAFRYELGVLYAVDLSKKKAPPGLMAGVGGYAQDPQNLDLAQYAQQLTKIPPAAWDAIWSSEDIQTDEALNSLATSIVAYLVDQYGWRKFVSFLSALSTTKNYREALQQIYQIDFSTLQTEWEQYVPLYYQERWQMHAWYGFDLHKYQVMLEAGAYTEASQGLEEALSFLENLEDNTKISQAQEMLAVAKTGQEAGRLSAQARRAVQEGEYTLCLDLTTQAAQMYATIGDTRRNTELAAYQSTAQELEAVFAELRQHPDNLIAGASTLGVERLQSARQLLEQLGNQQGVIEIDGLLGKMQAQQQRKQTVILFAGVLLCVGLLIVRILLLKRRTPVEAQL
jgi:hypothetical protein